MGTNIFDKFSGLILMTVICGMCLAHPISGHTRLGGDVHHLRAEVAGRGLDKHDAEGLQLGSGPGDVAGPAVRSAVAAEATPRLTQPTKVSRTRTGPSWE